MIPTPPALAYRRAATQHASVVGLVIALYDTLAGNLQRAKLAMDHQNVEARSRELKHGFAVLTQLDSLIDVERGGQTAQNLRRFYAYLRAEMLSAQFSQNASLFSRAAELLLDVRDAWGEVDSRMSAQTVALPLEGQESAALELAPIDYRV